MLALVALMLPQSFSSPKTQLAVLSGSENETLESILQEFSRDNGIEINMAYKGSLDIMNILDSGEIADYDAVWPANSLWISLGDKHKIVEDAKSVMTSPIVFGVRKSLAEQLGFVGREVSVKDILEAIEQKKLTFMMTSATQSNSGASAYIGFIYALLGNPETIASEDLDDPQFRDELKKLLGGVNRSSGSSGWLKELFLLGDYDSMVNYESMVIEANQRLVGEGREPLYAVYPYDGLTVSDSPLGFIDSGDENKKQAFAKLQQYLLSEPVQKQILALGRRTGIGGVAEGADRSVFNPDWGIDAQKTVSGLRMPAADVIMQALNLYQSELKKPSYTIYCLDYSGSMGGEREKRLKDAMRLILDQEQAKQHLLQATPQDVTTVMPFNHDVLGAWTVAGDDEGELGALSWRIDRLAVGGGTNIYAPVTAAIEELKHIDIDRYVPAIVLLTDGASNNGTFEQFERAYRRSALDVPVFAIKFGDASDDQLQALAELSRGAVFDGQKDLTSAFKKVRGYN
jgi:Ca-activated chloride channel family protein